MWRLIVPLLARRHPIIVPDLRAAGASAKPESGYTKKSMAVDIHEWTSSLRLDRVSIVGHDLGLMVAYACAAQSPRATGRVVLIDAFLPGIGNWKDVWLMRDLWHFHFYGDVPAGPGQGSRADLLRALLGLRGQSETLSIRGRSPHLCPGLGTTRGHARRLRLLPNLRTRRSGLRPVGRIRVSPCRCCS